MTLDHVQHVEGPSGTALVLLQEGGENSIVIVGGANQKARVFSDTEAQVGWEKRSVVLFSVMQAWVSWRGLVAA